MSALHKIRIFAAIIFFLAVTLLFLDVSGALAAWIGWTAKIQFVPALLAANVAVVIALVAVTLIFGRLYCSVICPLGVLQDILNRLNPKKMRFTYKRPHTWLRILMLVCFVALFIAGLGAIAAFLEPYSDFGRMVTGLLSPLYDSVANLLADSDAAADRYTFSHVTRTGATLPLIVIAAEMFAAIGLCSFIDGRIYCNSICPVGTVLGFLARFSWLKPVIDTDKCVNCGKCARKCKASCIDAKEHRIDYSRCVTCFDCIDNCSLGAISYTHPRAIPAAAPADTTDPRRRAFLSMTGVIAAAAATQTIAAKSQSGLAPIAPKQSPKRATRIVPPGSKSLKHLKQTCISCQLCISKCPNHVLRPSTSIDTLLQPVMGFEDGYCRPECTECSNVCPTGAISPITVEEKYAIQTGHAVVNPEACLAVQGEAPCGNCARHCPHGAIAMLSTTDSDGTTVTRPVVNENLCTGCGACEHLCPVSPVSAITVEGHEIHSEIQ